jgi:hypothetical protein
MTKKSFHERRGITFAEMGAFVATRNMLAMGLLEHDPTRTKYINNKHTFNMNWGCLTRGCGSVSCIGGTMALIMGIKDDAARYYVNDGGTNGVFSELFFPKNISKSYSGITPKQAVAAMDNWWKTGKPQWRKVLGLGRK